MHIIINLWRPKSTISRNVSNVLYQTFLLMVSLDDSCVHHLRSFFRDKIIDSI